MTVTDTSDHARGDRTPGARRRFTREQVSALRVRRAAADARTKALVARTTEFLAALKTGRSAPRGR
jgi:hypothetical protein